MERHERVAQGKSHIATDSLQLANLTKSFSTEGRQSSLWAGKELSDHFLTHEESWVICANSELWQFAYL